MKCHSRFLLACTQVVLAAYFTCSPAVSDEADADQVSNAEQVADVADLSSRRRIPAVGSISAMANAGQTPSKYRIKIVVDLGIYLIDFARINTREETFDLEGMIDATWTDPRLVLPSNERKGQNRSLNPSEAWTPSFEFINSLEQVKIRREGRLQVNDLGVVSWRVRFSGKFSSELDFNQFPFDNQILYICIATFDPPEVHTVLRADPRRSGRWQYAFLSDWNLGKVVSSVEPFEGDFRELSTSYFVAEVKISRRVSYYIWRVLIPLTLLVITSWAVYFFEPQNLQPLISTALGILLSMVTFTFSIDFSLPKLGYLTFLDRYIFTSFCFVLITIANVAIIHLLVRRNGVEPAHVWQRKCRYLFPILYPLVIVAISLYSFL